MGIEAFIMRAQLRWCGHVVDMSESRILQAVFYGELQTGTRFIGRPRKCYKDTLKANIQSCNLTLTHGKLCRAMTKPDGSSSAT